MTDKPAPSVLRQQEAENIVDERYKNFIACRTFGLGGPTKSQRGDFYREIAIYLEKELLRLANASRDSAPSVEPAFPTCTICGQHYELWCRRCNSGPGCSEPQGVREPEEWMRERINLFELHQKMTAHLFPSYSSTDERFLSLALAGEIGELCNMVKKRWRDGADLSEEIRDEIADIRVYLELLAKCFGIEGDKLDSRVQKKLQEVVKRKHASRNQETSAPAQEKK